MQYFNLKIKIPKADSDVVCTAEITLFYLLYAFVSDLHSVFNPRHLVNVLSRSFPLSHLPRFYTYCLHGAALLEPKTDKILQISAL